MKKNIHSVDRIVRVLLALAIAMLYFTDQISGTVALVLGILAVVFLATSFASFCPIYYGLKISTLKKSETK
ncbi:MAG: DUF2892 domain-containing protein [Bacteroidota bacterium]|nr:DUF2892 domain-containing protein [Bacteroidota bacterium]